jgi:predicted DNA-binding mobile mystery protein A
MRLMYLGANMKTNLNSLAMTQIERRLDSLREIKGKTIVSNGWIKFIRKAMGLSSTDLAKLSNLSPRTVTQAERREIEGKISLSTLKKMAEAMECELVYSLVPKASVRDTIKNKAKAKAIKRLKEAGLHMKLEAQEAESNIQDQIEVLTQKLIDNGDVW